MYLCHVDMNCVSFVCPSRLRVNSRCLLRSTSFASSIVYLLTSCVKHRIYSRDCHSTVTGSDVSTHCRACAGSFSREVRRVAHLTRPVSHRIRVSRTGSDVHSPSAATRPIWHVSSFDSASATSARFVQSALADACFKTRSAP